MMAANETRMVEANRTRMMATNRTKMVGASQGERLTSDDDGGHWPTDER